jgi:hypothetical protein
MSFSKHIVMIILWSLMPLCSTLFAMDKSKISKQPDKQISSSSPAIPQEELSKATQLCDTLKRCPT